MLRTLATLLTAELHGAVIIGALVCPFGSLVGSGLDSCTPARVMPWVCHRGWNRALSPLSDNALWGFVERASNWGVPFALLALQKTQG